MWVNVQMLRESFDDLCEREYHFEPEQMAYISFEPPGNMCVMCCQFEDGKLVLFCHCCVHFPHTDRCRKTYYSYFEKETSSQREYNHCEKWLLLEGVKWKAINHPHPEWSLGHGDKKSWIEFKLLQFAKLENTRTTTTAAEANTSNRCAATKR